MTEFDSAVLKQLYSPASSSHKSQNGKVMLIAGSKLFHAASLWPLIVMSRVVDMVFYASTTENNEIVTRMKEEFRNGIVIPRDKIDDYMQEADAILIGPGLPRESGKQKGDDDTKVLTESLLKKYANKKWVIDGGSLQVIDPEILPPTSIVTPHQREFELLKSRIKNHELRMKVESSGREDQAKLFAQTYNCTILLKGEKDIVSNGNETVIVNGGNAGMTKGGTGDVLAGLVTALYAKNEAFLSASAASYINKRAGDSLFERVGLYFNASDLAEEIPEIMADLV